MSAQVTASAAGLPPAAQINCVEPRILDYFRMGWWGFKALRFSSIAVVLGLIVICLFAVLYWVLDDGNPRLVIADLAITIAVLVASMTLLSTLVWVVFACTPKARIYMSQSYRAAIVLTARPCVAPTSKYLAQWELKNHTVQHTGCGLGAELRDAMSSPLKAAAVSGRVRIYGKAANAKVQNLYIEQFESWGLKRLGKKAVVWP